MWIVIRKKEIRNSQCEIKSWLSSKKINLVHKKIIFIKIRRANNSIKTTKKDYTWEINCIKCCPKQSLKNKILKR